jgi:hypothetical protein
MKDNDRHCDPHTVTQRSYFYIFAFAQRHYSQLRQRKDVCCLWFQACYIPWKTMQERLFKDYFQLPSTTKEKYWWNSAVPWLRRLVAGLSPRRPGLASGSVHVEFVVDKVALGHVFLRVLQFSLSISFHRGSPYSCHLGDEQQACQYPQFRDTVSPHRHEQLGGVPSVSELPRNVLARRVVLIFLQGIQK